MNKSPFKFLDSYTLDDRAIFFGRDSEIEELYHRVFESKLMLVYGVSGTGKSSLIHCGLANKFQETDWLPLVIRRGGNMIESMAASINAASITPQKGQASTPAQFKKAVRSLYLDHYKPVFFLFDQFEELFIFGDREERKAFIAIVKSLIESDLQCRLLFVMREEYMAGVTEFEKYIPSFFANRVRIEKMSHTNALEAIEKPCRVFNIRLEEGFAENLLEKLSPESGEVELTYLQVSLDKIFRMTQEKPGDKPDQGSISFTIPLLGKIGTVSDLLGSFLDDQVALMENQEAALAILKSFVSVKGTKRQLSLSEVKENAHALGKTIGEQALLEMIQSFVHLRILRDKDQYGKYELRHDSLAAKIYEKISSIEKEILEIRQFIENANFSWEKRGVLISQADLDYIQPFRNRLYLSDELKGLLERSERALAVAKRRRRNLAIAIPSAMVIVLCVFLLWVFIEKKKSDRNYILSRANYFGSLAMEAAVTDPTKALRIAEYAMSLDSSENIKKAMYQIYRENSFYRTIAKLSGSISSICLSPDGKSLLVGTSDKNAYLLDLEGNIKQPYRGHTAGITAVAFSPTGDSILTGSSDGSAILWHINGDSIHNFTTGRIRSLAYSPDGKKILTGSGSFARLWDIEGKLLRIIPGMFECRAVDFYKDGNSFITSNIEERILTLWDLNGKRIREFKNPRGGIWDAKFSPDGKSILTGTSSNTARLYNLAGEVIQEFDRNGHESMVTSVSFSPNGKMILTASSYDKTIRLWNLYGEVIHVFKCQDFGVISAIFAPDGKAIYSISGDRKIRFWKLEGNYQLIKEAGEDFLYSFAFSEKSKSILILRDSAVHVTTVAELFDMQGNVIRSFKDPESRISTSNIYGSTTIIAISPDGQNILTRADGRTARLWNRKGKELNKFKNVSQILDFSDSTLSIISTDSTLSIYDHNGSLLNKYKGHLFLGGVACISPDKKTLLVGTGSVARLVDMNNKLLKEFRGHDGGISALAFSPDGKLILTGSGDLTVRLWNLNGSLLQVLKAHKRTVIGVAFSPDGQKILTNSQDGIGLLWDLDGNLIQTFNERWTIGWSKFINQGKSVIASSLYGSVHIFDIKPSLSEFQSMGNYDELSVSQKLETGILSFKDVYKLRDTAQLHEAGNWYYKNFDILIAEKRTEYLDNSIKLLGKAAILNSNAAILRDLLNANISRITQIKVQKSEGNKTKKEIEQINQRILKLNSLEDLYSFASYFIGLYSSSDSTIYKLYFDECLFQLIDKIISQPENETYLVNLLGICVNSYQSNPVEKMKKEIERINQKVLNFKSFKDLYSASGFYLSLADLTRKKLNIQESVIQLYERILSYPNLQEEVKSDVGTLRNISWTLLRNRQFKPALNGLQICWNADSTNTGTIGYISMAYILNDQYANARRIMEKWKNQPWGSNTYASGFLGLIASLEKGGIKHPDFEKARELLKN